MERLNITNIIIFIGCVGYIITPRSNIYWLPIQALPSSISHIYYHYFRTFLKTRPPGQQTLNNYLYITLSWAAQASMLHSLGLLIMALFADDVNRLVIDYPQGMCLLISSPPYAVLQIAFVFFLMSAVRLFIFFFPNRFMAMDHERVHQRILVFAIFLAVCETARRLFTSGGLCVSFMPYLVVSLGINEDELPFRSTTSTSNPTLTFLLILTCINYSIPSMWTHSKNLVSKLRGHPQHQGGGGGEANHLASTAQETKSLSKKLFEVATFGGCVSAASLLALCCIYMQLGDGRWAVRITVIRLAHVVIVCMPVYWMKNIEDAHQGMTRKLRERMDTCKERLRSIRLGFFQTISESTQTRPQQAVVKNQPLSLGKPEISLDLPWRGRISDRHLHKYSSQTHFHTIHIENECNQITALAPVDIQ